MRREDALKKLGKILGKKLGYRVDPKAPDQDDRHEAASKLQDVIAKRNSLSAQMEARRTEILKADAEYQRLKAEHADARKACETLLGITSRYRFTVGTSGDLFFTVKAQGDSWEEIIAKLEKAQ